MTRPNPCLQGMKQIQDAGRFGPTSGVAMKRGGHLKWTAGFAAGLIALASADLASAQVGIGVTSAETAQGTVGYNKQQADSAAFRCPDGTVAIGLEARDKTVGAPRLSTWGMTTYFGAYCANIVPTPTGFNLVPLNTTTPSVFTRYAYNFQGPTIRRNCGTNQIIHRVGGWDRDWDDSTQYPAWASALTMVCDTITINASGWVRISTAGTNKQVVGVVELPPVTYLPTHDERGPFCDNTSTSLVTGLYAQSGGEGIDGINVFCGGLAQARFSSVLTFTDFAWNKTLGGSGWTTDLRLNTTLLSNTAGMSGQARTPYASASDNNVNAYSVPHEVYVLPNSNYRAVVNGRPTGIPANSFIQRGTCTTGITLANEQDAACALEVVGLPDLTPTVTSPPATYVQYGQAQPVTVTVANLGPGATAANDGFTVQTTVPAGWSASNLPTGCSLSGAVVTCAITTVLNAAAQPGQTGGTVSFTFNLTPNSPTVNGTYNLPVRVNTDVPNGDSDPTNNDYNAANNEATGQLRLLLNARLNLSKVWADANVGDTARLTATRDSTVAVTLDAVANTASETDTGAFANLAPSSTYVLAEVLGASNVGAYNASAWTCTGGTLAGNQLTLSNADSGKDITCSITNSRQVADVRVTKVADRATVRSGELITWTITATNAGPNAANGAVLSDTPGAGLDCNVPPPPVCTSSGGASCPMNVSASALATGVPVGTFPPNISITVTLTCRATADGI